MWILTVADVFGTVCIVLVAGVAAWITVDQWWRWRTGSDEPPPERDSPEEGENTSPPGE